MSEECCFIPGSRFFPNRVAARAAFKKHGGVLRMTEAVKAGIHRRTLYTMRDAGIIEQLSRGLYRLADAPALGNPDLVSEGLQLSGRCQTNAHELGFIQYPKAIAVQQPEVHRPTIPAHAVPA